MILDILSKAYQEGTIIGFRTIKMDWDKLIIGYITMLDANSFRIKEINDDGFFIGTSEVPIKIVVSIDINTKYENNLSFINKHRDKLDFDKGETIWTEKEVLSSYFDSLIKNKKIVTLFFDGEDEYITGFIMKNDKFDVMIRVINQNGEDDGETYYPIDNIKGIGYNNVEEQKIELLYKNREGSI